MMFRRLAAGFAIAAIAVTAAACGSSGDDKPKVDVAKDVKFKAGTTMAKLHDADKITIGTKYDQPGIGFKNPATGQLEGFDVEMGKIVAAKLGIAPDKISWKEVVSKNRETFIQQNQIDIMIGSYSITDDRKKLVDFAGPYYVTGQQLLVRKDDNSINGPTQLKGKKVCSVTGSTSLDTVEQKYGANPIPFDTYQKCVDSLLDKQVDAVTTDGAILLGYAAQKPDDLKVVGDAFSTENYGIGLKKGDQAFRDFLNDTIEGSYKDGSWKKAFTDTLGKAKVPTPTPPKVDRY
ncbi:MAG TPA: glutamate ABC transporter substrate-binding protein [Mycobacteriales bacterium]|nr:glutamate ABC transporter substrate-binding protein [Mycobacteriales bacterium]